MKLFLDSSNVAEIARAVETGLIDGVTTNPSLMLQAGEDPTEVLHSIANLFSWNASISAEVVGDTADDMLAMADDYISINPNITIKLPCTRQGLIACRELSADDISTNVTLIFTATQALLAAKSGATYVSPFVGRVCDQHWDGIDLVEEISELFVMNDVDTQILAASIREPRQVSKAFLAGADICTIPVKVFDDMYDHMLTRSGLEKFNEDWKKVMEL
ncbi:transaldolase-like protein [Synechococcus phage S-SZBM1]|uniref:Transaldolase-like protein n=1 Tax=Synechococcus phage S-SZBM1 TaxID=2926475 RepID=A0AC61TSM4_9CAUD|nr:transaldolase [Synechococcus phage S-SZBM1]UNH61242.1 transaldolase-like protein [Synechococcus phage S-SZBM1]